MNIKDLLDIKYPFIQGAMANISDGTFAAKVSEGGGLGIIASGGLNCAQIREEILKAKKITDKPFGLNLLMLHEQIEEIVDIAIENKISCVTTGAGNPAKYIKRLKENKIKIFPVVSNKSLAIRMQNLGVDGIIVEGEEAAGHIGESSTFVLLPQISDAVDIPVIAAGGIYSGKTILAAEILGAKAVQIGTAMLFTKECPIHENYKQKLIKTKTSQVTVIGRLNGYATRVVKNSMTNKYLEIEKTTNDKRLLENMTLGALRKAVYEGDMVNGSIMAGQVVGSLDEILSIKEYFEKIYTQYIELKDDFKRGIL